MDNRCERKTTFPGRQKGAGSVDVPAGHRLRRVLVKVLKTYQQERCLPVMNLRIACNLRLILLIGERMNGVPLPREMRLPKVMQKILFDSLNPREAEMLRMSPFLLRGQNLRQSRTREVFLLPPSGDEVPGRWLQLVQQVWGQARAW